MLWALWRRYRRGQKAQVLRRFVAAGTTALTCRCWATTASCAMSRFLSVASTEGYVHLKLVHTSMPVLDLPHSSIPGDQGAYKIEIGGRCSCSQLTEHEGASWTSIRQVRRDKRPRLVVDTRERLWHSRSGYGRRKHGVNSAQFQEVFQFATVRGCTIVRMDIHALCLASATGFWKC